MEHEDKDVIMNTRSHQAFSLIELMFALAIAAILAMVAAPSLQRALAHNRIIQADNQLVAALNLSRTEAVTRGTAVVLCPSIDGQRCTAGQHWEKGWLVAADQNHDFQPDSTPIHVAGAQADGIRIHSSRGRLRVRYRADGSTPGSNISLIVCRAGQPKSARSVVVSNSGRPRQGTASTAQAMACSQS